MIKFKRSPSSSGWTLGELVPRIFWEHVTPNQYFTTYEHPDQTFVVSTRYRWHPEQNFMYVWHPDTLLLSFACCDHAATSYRLSRGNVTHRHVSIFPNFQISVSARPPVWILTRYTTRWVITSRRLVVHCPAGQAQTRHARSGRMLLWTLWLHQRRAIFKSVIKPNLSQSMPHP